MTGTPGIKWRIDNPDTLPRLTEVDLHGAELVGWHRSAQFAAEVSAATNQRHPGSPSPSKGQPEIADVNILYRMVKDEVRRCPARVSGLCLDCQAFSIICFMARHESERKLNGRNAGRPGVIRPKRQNSLHRRQIRVGTSHRANAETVEGNDQRILSHAGDFGENEHAVGQVFVGIREVVCAVPAGIVGANEARQAGPLAGAGCGASVAGACADTGGIRKSVRDRKAALAPKRGLADALGFRLI